MDEIILDGYAKVNLTLDIVGRREDGYHLLRSVMQQIKLGDSVALRRNGQKGIKLNLELSPAVRQNTREELSTGPDNLAIRAARMLLEDAHREEGIEIRLMKNIPLAAGMAGGSTDAATVLKGLNMLLDLGYSEERLCTIGAKLGADIPFCIKGGTVMCEGIGECMTPLPSVEGIPVLLAKPPIGVSTKEVYTLFDEKFPHPAATLDNDALMALLKGPHATLSASSLVPYLGNVLQDVTESLHPEIRQLRETMLKLGASGALMSGSGPTVFGLFEDISSRDKALHQLEDSNPGMFLAGTCTV